MGTWRASTGAGEGAAWARVATRAIAVATAVFMMDDGLSCVGLFGVWMGQW